MLLATCEHYAHVLNEYSDAELKDVVAVATKQRECDWLLLFKRKSCVALLLLLHRALPSTNITHYKEVQIHGPLQLNRDVEALVVSGVSARAIRLKRLRR